MLIFTVLFYIFIVVILIQITYYGIVFGNFSFKNDLKYSPNTFPISVIVCAKNEAENLEKHLPFLLEQDYTKFEIILINDSSNDHTLEVMEHFRSAHAKVKIVDVKNTEAFWGNKKYALTLGIKAASFDHLLFTDADCKPLSKYWISEISGHFSNRKEIVIGYGAYKKQPKSFLNKLIRFETLITALQYFSYAKLGQPYMAVGRNLAYTKNTFFKARGFMTHMHIKSGDDDLFVNENATISNTSLCYSKDSFTESIPKKTYAEWLIQKSRHVSTANYYKAKHKLPLALFYITQVLFYMLSIVLISTYFHWQIVVGLIVLRYIVMYISVIGAAKKLNEQDLITYLPLLELFLITSQFSIFIQNLSSRTHHWK